MFPPANLGTVDSSPPGYLPAALAGSPLLASPGLYAACLPAGPFGGDDPLPAAAALGDLDDDGAVDVVLAYESGAPSPGVYAATGAFTGGYPVVHDSVPVQVSGIGSTTRFWPASLTDIDGDTVPDLVYVELNDRTADSIMVSLNGGAPSFVFAAPTAVASVSTLTEDVASDIAVADIDLDGAVDLAWSRIVGEVCILYAVTPGVFSTGTRPRVCFSTTFPLARQLALDDWDGDGDVDVLVVSGAGVLVMSNAAGGAGVFSLAGTAVAPEFPSPWASRLVVADVDNDGDNDYVMAAGPALRFVRRDGPAVLTTFDVGSGAHDLVALGSLNGDAALDMVSLNGTGLIMYVFNTGAGAFDPGVVVGVSPTFLPSDLDFMSLADVNGDGFSDLVVVTRSDTMWVALHTLVTMAPFATAPEALRPTGFVMEGTRGYTPSYSQGFVRLPVADVDGDGRAEWVVSRVGVASLDILSYTDGGAGGWPSWSAPSRLLAPVVSVTAVYVVDGNGDGALDIVTSSGSDLLFFAQTATSLVFNTSPSPNLWPGMPSGVAEMTLGPGPATGPGLTSGFLASVAAPSPPLLTVYHLAVTNYTAGSATASLLVSISNPETLNIHATAADDTTLVVGGFDDGVYAARGPGYQLELESALFSLPETTSPGSVTGLAVLGISGVGALDVAVASTDAAVLALPNSVVSLPATAPSSGSDAFPVVAFSYAGTDQAFDLMIQTGSSGVVVVPQPRAADLAAETPTLSSGGTCNEIAVADLTGDGHVDALCWSGQDVRLVDDLSQDSPLSWSLLTDVATHSSTDISGRMLSADVNGDGAVDVVYVTPGPPPAVHVLPAIPVVVGGTTTSFTFDATAPVSVDMTPCAASSSVILFAGNASTGPSLLCFETGTGDLYALSWEGSAFASPVFVASNPVVSSSVFYGTLGSVTPSSTGTDVIFYRVNTLGYFPRGTEPAVLLFTAPPGEAFLHVAATDLNGDGFADVVVPFSTPGSQRVAYFLGPGFGVEATVNVTQFDAAADRQAFVPPFMAVETESGYFGARPLIDDMDGDGVDDVVLYLLGGVAGQTPSQILYTKPDASDPWAHLEATVRGTTGQVTNGVATAGIDVNGDGSTDLALEYLLPQLSATPFAVRSPAQYTVPVESCGFTLGCVAATFARAAKCVGDTVYLPGGTYTGCGVHAPFMVQRSVTLLPKPGTGSVTLDCSPATGAAFGGGGGGGGRFGFHVMGAGVTVVVRDMTIVGAVSDPSSFGGAAFTVTSATLVLERVSVVNATTLASTLTSAESPSLGYGAGVLVRGGGTLVAVNSTFSGCAAAIGGGAVGAVGAETSVTLCGCTMTGNTATQQGGALFAEATTGTTRVSIVDTVFEDNVAAGDATNLSPTSFGGAVAVLVLGGRVELTVSGSRFEANSALSFGGGISLRSRASASFSVTLRTTTFADNSAGLHGGGASVGAADLVEGDVVLGPGLVWDSNTAGGSGGGLAVLTTASVLAPLTSSPRVLFSGLDDNDGSPAAASVFVDNVAGKHGGGVAVLVSQSTLAPQSAVVGVLPRGTQFEGNKAGQMGGAIAVLGRANVTVPDGVLVENQAVFGIVATGPDASYLADTDGTSAAALGGEPATTGTLACASRGVLTLAGTVSGSGNGAVYGGLGFACGTRVEVSGVSSSLLDATGRTETAKPGFGPTAGGFAYVCLPWTAAPSGCSSSGIPFVSFDAVTEAALNATAGLRSTVWPYNADAGSPPAVIAWLVAPSASRSTGVPLGPDKGLIDVTDVFGQPVLDPGVTLELSFTTADAGDLVFVTGSNLQALTSSPVSFADVGIALRVGTATGIEVEFRVTVSQWGVPPESDLFSQASASVVLNACEPGSGVRVNGDPGVLECEVCPDSFFSNATSLDPCVPCPGDALLAGPGSTRCVSCPAGTTAVAGTLDSSSELGINCTCLPQYFSPLGVDNVVCRACPEGAVCRGGRAAPTAAPGFFPSTTSPFEFVRCKRDGACVGGEAGLCARGHQGYLCNTCVSGYYTDPSGGCSKCSTASTALFAVFVLLVVLLGLLMLGVVVLSMYRMAHSTVETVCKETGRPLRLIPATMGMSIVAMQIVGVIADSNVYWNSSAGSILDVFNVFNLDVAGWFESECTTGSWHATFAISVLFPVLMMGVMFAGGVVLKVLHSTGVFQTVPLSLVEVLETAGFTFGPVLYIPLARVTLSFWACTQLPNGDYVLTSDPGVACFDDAWWGVLVLALFALAVYVVGIPGYFAVALYSHRHTLFDASVVARYGPLFRLWRKSWYLGEIAELGRRLALVAMATFFAGSQLIQLSGILIILSASAAIVLYLTPYFYDIYNSHQLRLGALLLLLALTALGSYAERSSGGSADAFFVTVVIIIVVSLVAVALHSAVVEIKEIYLERRGAYSTVDVQREKLIRQIRRVLPDLDAEFQRDVGVLLERFEGEETTTPWAAAEPASACGPEPATSEILMDDLDMGVNNSGSDLALAGTGLADWRDNGMNDSQMSLNLEARALGLQEPVPQTKSSSSSSSSST